MTKLFWIFLLFAYNSLELAPTKELLTAIHFSGQTLNSVNAAKFFLMLKENIKDQSCTERLGVIFSNFMSNPALGRIFANSGKGFNDVGDYQSCGLEGEEYMMGIGVVLQNMWTGIGACLPLECSPEVMSATRPIIASFLSELIHIPIDPSLVVMQVPAEINKDLNKLKTGGKIFLWILLIIAIVSIAATILEINGFLPSKDMNIPQKIISCFSLRKNVIGILSTENRVDPNLEVLNGIRVLSIGWVVLGHAFLFMLFSPLLNPMDILDLIFTDRTIGLIKAGTLAVDVFFFLSGFLAALAMYRGFKDKKNINVKNILLSYLYRYLRLLPLFAIIICYEIYLNSIFFDTPANTSCINSIRQCNEQWWKSLLYINNFLTEFNDLCAPWVWYIMIDMQLYIITPFIMIAYCWNKKIGMMIIGFICLCSFGTLIGIASYWEFNLSFVKANFKKDPNTATYMKPYTRLAPYFIGIFLFIVYNECKNENTELKFTVSLKNLVFNNRLVRYGFYLIGFVIMYICVYSFYWIDNNPNDWGVAFGVIHFSFVRSVFIIGLCLVIYPVLIGKGKILLGILGHYVWNPLGKLTYGTYMLHIPLLNLYILSFLQGRFFTLFEAFSNTIMGFFLSYILSFILTLFFESPIVQLLKNFLENKRPVQPVKDKPLAKTAETPTE